MSKYIVKNIFIDLYLKSVNDFTDNINEAYQFEKIGAAMKAAADENDKLGRILYKITPVSSKL